MWAFSEVAFTNPADNVPTTSHTIEHIQARLVLLRNIGKTFLKMVIFSEEFADCEYFKVDSYIVGKTDYIAAKARLSRGINFF